MDEKELGGCCGLLIAMAISTMMWIGICLLICKLMN